MSLLQFLQRHGIPLSHIARFKWTLNYCTMSNANKFQVDSKYKGLESNVWIELNSLNDILGNCVNLGQGFPDFQPAPGIVAHLEKVCKPDPTLYSLHQYARAYGHPRLVKALAALYGKLLSRTIDPMNEVLVTGGAYGALFYTIMSNVGVGDEVIVIEPYFDCYEPMIKLAGGTAKYIPLEMKEEGHNKKPLSSLPSSKEWTLDMQKLTEMFNPKTKAIIINTPNNPLGKMFSMEELTGIASLCKKFNVLVISDEVYEWLVYDGNKHIRIASLPGMWERTVTIGSAGKTFSLTGWKLGWAYGPENLIRNLQIAHQNCTYMCQTPEQEAVAAALEVEIENLGTKKSFFHQMTSQLVHKRDEMVEALRAAGMVPVVPEGGYFILADWSPIREKVDLNSETDQWEDFRFVKWLAKKRQLLGIPPSAFYSQGHKHLAKNYIRFNFYKKDSTLEEAKRILQDLTK